MAGEAPLSHAETPHVSLMHLLEGETLAHRLKVCRKALEIVFEERGNAPPQSQQVFKYVAEIVAHNLTYDEFVERFVATNVHAWMIV